MSSEFIGLAHRAGVLVGHLVPDGRIRRVPTVTHPGKRNGAVCWYGDGGLAWNWETGERVSWSAGRGGSSGLSPEQRREHERVRRLALEQDRRIRERGALEARRLVDTAYRSKHDYLIRKQLPVPWGLIAASDVAAELHVCPPEVPCLLVPMRNIVTDKLQGVQRIFAEDDGFAKRMLRGSVADMAVFRIGQDRRGKKQRVYVEGYATGLSVSAAIPAAEVVVCFSAGNLEKVARAEGRPADVVFADHDASGRGAEAARVTGIRWCMSEVEGWDASDVWMQRGGHAIAALVLKASAAGAVG